MFDAISKLGSDGRDVRSKCSAVRGIEEGKEAARFFFVYSPVLSVGLAPKSA